MERGVTQTDVEYGQPVPACTNTSQDLIVMIKQMSTIFWREVFTPICALWAEYAVDKWYEGRIEEAVQSKFEAIYAESSKLKGVRRTLRIWKPSGPTFDQELTVVIASHLKTELWSVTMQRTTSTNRMHHLAYKAPGHLPKFIDEVDDDKNEDNRPS